MDALDDSGSAKHAGFEEKEVRRLRRQKRLAKAGKEQGIGRGRVKEDSEYVSLKSYAELFLSEIELGSHLSCIRIHPDKKLGVASRIQILSYEASFQCAKLTMNRRILLYHQCDP